MDRKEDSSEKTALTDGVCSVKSTEYSWTGMISADVTVKDGKIEDITITEEHESDTVQLEGYDVIVVGPGGSGISAYCAAAEEGAAVFGMEKAAKLGGQSATVTGPMVIQSKSPAFKDIEFANPDDVYQIWLDYVEIDEKSDIIREAVYNSGIYLDYYIDNFDFEFDGMIKSFAKPEWSQFWTRYVGENGSTNIFGVNKTYQ